MPDTTSDDAVNPVLPAAARRSRGPRSLWRDWVASSLRPRAQIARMIPTAGWDLVAPLILMNLLAGALPVAFVIATSVVVGRVPAAVDAGVDSPAWDSLVAAFVLAAAAFLLAQAITPVLVAINARLRRRIDGRLRQEVLALVHQSTSIAPMEDKRVLDELAEASRQFDSDWHTPGQAVGGMLSLIARYSSLLAFCALLSWLTLWWTGLAMLACTLMFRYGNRGGLRKFSQVWRTIMPASRSYDYLRDLAMSDAAAKETRIFGLNRWLSRRYENAHWRMFGPVASERRRIYFYPYIPITLIGFAITAAVVYGIGQAAARGDIGLTALALGLQAVMGAVMLGGAYEEADVPTQFGMRAVQALHELRGHVDAATRREQEQTVAQRARVTRREAEAAAAADVPSLPSHSLVFDKVRFSYPGSSEKVLTGLSLEIPAGRSTAIVGVNGAGKTTLVKLLTRLYEPTGGAILADGVNIGLVDPAAWRRQVSVIFQDFVRYEFTAADNIAMGAIHAPAGQGSENRAVLERAAARAGILDAFAEHPLGLDTPLARAYENGIDLSGGQWQRIAIARSLYALSQGAKVLVLDEPTSALDVRAEVAFFDRFVELTQGVTSILISHRFSSVRRADHIVVVDRGKVAEQGSHVELMAAGGHYATLFTLQAERFARGLDAEGEASDMGVETDGDTLVDSLEGAS